MLGSQAMAAFCLSSLVLGCLFISRKSFRRAETFHRAVVTAGMASLIASRERVVNIAFDTISFPADGVDDGVTVASDVRVVFFQALNQL
jgi:hypothetical protein